MEEDIVYSNNPNEDSVQMKIGGKYHKAYLTRSVSEDIMYQDNPNVPKVLFTGSDGKKHTAYLVKGVNSHNLGWYATPEALQAAHPTGNNGDWAMVGSTDTVWTWDADTSAWVDTGTTNAANKNLSNLTATGANIANWSSNVSNCITEIPQDINLELNNGTLTLKAGSKVYNPDGTYITIASDVSINTAPAGTAMVCVHSNGSALYTQYPTNIVSGVTDSKAGETYHWWYDTTNNVINRYTNSGSTPSQTMTLPIAIITSPSGTISSIDQVFNGFGYIGSTVFALPGVSVLAPDGRNQDGTLKTYAYTVPSVIRRTDTTNGTYFLTINCNNGAFGVGQYVYDETTNYNYVNNAVSDKRCIVASATTTSGKMSNLTVKTPFHAVDYSDTEFIGHQAMPSSRYISLSVPASGGTVTAPADGLLCFGLVVANIGEGISLLNATTNAGSESHPSTTTNAKAILAVSKGDVISVYYTGAGTKVFRFVYANGSK